MFEVASLNQKPRIILYQLLNEDIRWQPTFLSQPSVEQIIGDIIILSCEWPRRLPETDRVMSIRVFCPPTEAQGLINRSYYSHSILLRFRKSGKSNRSRLFSVSN